MDMYIEHRGQLSDGVDPLYIIVPVWLICGVAAFLLGRRKRRVWDGFWLGLLYGPLGLFGAIVMAPAHVQIPDEG